MDVFALRSSEKLGVNIQPKIITTQKPLFSKLSFGLQAFLGSFCTTACFGISIFCEENQSKVLAVLITSELKAAWITS